MDKFNIINGDCIKVMHIIGDNTVDLILCDPPYGTTSCAWDNIIPFSEMWEQANRILKKIVQLYCLVPNHLRQCV